ASLKLTSMPVPVNAGLASTQPPPSSSLSRGPTPSGPSFAPTRVPLTIARVTAGSNTEGASRTIDDDETTGWASEGKLSAAWIEYELSTAATVSEVTLKLSNGKRKAYPLRVTVDGNEAFTGISPLSLGYVTLTLKPISGKLVRIQLTGAP